MGVIDIVLFSFFLGGGILILLVVVSEGKSAPSFGLDWELDKNIRLDLCKQI